MGAGWRLAVVSGVQSKDSGRPPITGTCNSHADNTFFSQFFFIFVVFGSKHNIFVLHSDIADGHLFRPCIIIII